MIFHSALNVPCTIPIANCGYVNSLLHNRYYLLLIDFVLFIKHFINLQLFNYKAQLKLEYANVCNYYIYLYKSNINSTLCLSIVTFILHTFMAVVTVSWCSSGCLNMIRCQLLEITYSAYEDIDLIQTFCLPSFPKTPPPPPHTHTHTRPPPLLCSTQWHN